MMQVKRGKFRKEGEGQEKKDTFQNSCVLDCFGLSEIFVISQLGANLKLCGSFSPEVEGKSSQGKMR